MPRKRDFLGRRLVDSWGDNAPTGVGETLTGTLKATEHYRPGALSGPADGYERYAIFGSFE